VGRARAFPRGDCAGQRPGTDATRVRGRRRVDDRCFPDYRWELRRVVFEGEWLAVHMHDVGTRAGAFLIAPGDGTRIETDEFDMYRIVDGLIREVEGTADNARLCS
jgi:predicted ester cyclase